MLSPSISPRCLVIISSFCPHDRWSPHGEDIRFLFQLRMQRLQNPTFCALTWQHRLGLQKSQIHTLQPCEINRPLKNSCIQDLTKEPDPLSASCLRLRLATQTTQQEDSRSTGHANILQPTGTDIRTSEELSCLGYRSKSKYCYS